MTEENNTSLKIAIEAIQAEGWARGYAACLLAQRAELEWQRDEIERLRADNEWLRRTVASAIAGQDWQIARNALEQQGKNHADTK